MKCKVKTLPYIDYNITVEKGIWDLNKLNWATLSSAQLGSVYGNIQTGLRLTFNNRRGLYYMNIQPEPRDYIRNKVYFHIATTASCKAVAYNVLFNRETENGSDELLYRSFSTERFVLYGAVQMSAFYHGVSLGYQFQIHTRELTGSMTHMWGTILLSFRLSRYKNHIQ